ncbi:MAG: O-antigen ligase family protein [Verrucomicrobiia bacterium]
MPRALLIYALVLPLAMLLGFMLATPTDFNSFAFIMMALTVVCIPMILKHHHLMLAATWNAALIVFFLPGQPQLGMVLAIVSLGIAIVTRTLTSQRRFLQIPAITWPLIMLTVVVLVTAKLTGGIGARVLGAETWGAKRYLGVFGAIIGYFAFTTQSIPKDKAKLYVAAFFLGGLTAMMSDLIFMAGPQFYFLFVLFPSDYASLQAITAETIMRLSGVSFACAWAYYFFISRYGIHGIFDPKAPWRFLLMVACVAGSLLGGYRGLLILMMLVFATQFFVEGVYRTKLGPVMILGVLLAVIGTITVIDRMPLAVQRAFSFLPLERVDQAARKDAMGTLDWRLSMWKILIPEVPKYLLLGKGYGFSGTDYYLTQESMRRGMYSAYEDTLVSGNYHNGILTLLIPFGIFGFGAFVWFCGSALWVLIRNFRYGDPDLKTVNTALLALFSARLVFYVVFYGQFDSDFANFAGILGMSVALNGGVASSTVPEPVSQPEAIPSWRLEPQAPR